MEFNWVPQHGKEGGLCRGKHRQVQPAWLQIRIALGFKKLPMQGYEHNIINIYILILNTFWDGKKEPQPPEFVQKPVPYSILKVILTVGKAKLRVKKLYWRSRNFSCFQNTWMFATFVPNYWIFRREAGVKFHHFVAPRKERGRDALVPSVLGWLGAIPALPSCSGSSGKGRNVQGSVAAPHRNPGNPQK